MLALLAAYLLQFLVADGEKIVSNRCLSSHHCQQCLISITVTETAELQLELQNLSLTVHT